MSDRKFAGLRQSGFFSFVLPFLVLVATVQIRITDSGIVPATISGRIDEKIRLNIQNEGTKTHNFVLPSFYIFTPNLPPHQGTTVEFIPDKKGVFSYYSDAGGHPEPGLSGSFHVK